MGLCSTPLHPGAARSIGQWFPAGESALANGLITGASILAYAVVHPVFGRLTDQFEWPRAFLITGAATFALALVWWWVGSDGSFGDKASAPSPGAPAGTESYGVAVGTESSGSARPPAVLPYEVPPPPPPPLPPVGPLWHSRELWLLTVSYAAVGYFQYLFFYWLHYYFDAILKWDKVQSRYYAGLPSLAMAAAMPLGGLLLAAIEPRFGRRKRFVIPLLGMLTAAACLLIGLKAVGAGWVVTWFTLALAFLGLCESAFWVTAVELGGRRAGTSAAIMNTGGNGIGLLAPVLTPLISSRFGWGGGLFVGALVAVVGAVCWLGIRRTHAAASDA
jgi:MFS family permease